MLKAETQDYFKGRRIVLVLPLTQQFGCTNFAAILSVVMDCDYQTCPNKPSLSQWIYFFNHLRLVASLPLEIFTPPCFFWARTHFHNEFLMFVWVRTFFQSPKSWAPSRKSVSCEHGRVSGRYRLHPVSAFSLEEKGILWPFKGTEVKLFYQQYAIQSISDPPVEYRIPQLNRSIEILLCARKLFILNIETLHILSHCFSFPVI